MPTCNIKGAPVIIPRFPKYGQEVRNEQGTISTEVVYLHTVTWKFILTPEPWNRWIWEASSQVPQLQKELCKSQMNADTTLFCPLVVVRLKKNLKHKNTIVSTLMWNLHHSLGNYMVLVMKDAKLSYPEALAQVSLHSPHTCSRSPFPGPCGVLSLFTSSPLAFFRLLMAVACMISLMMFRLCGRQEVRAGGLGCGWIICLQVVHLHTATLLWG